RTQVIRAGREYADDGNPEDGRPEPLPGPRGHLPGHARESSGRYQDPVRFRAQDQRLRRGPTGRASPPPERGLVADSATRWHASVLAGHRVTLTLGAVE